MFFKGALLKDSKGVLKEQGKNTQSARRMQITSVQQVAELERTIKAYVRQAIEVEKASAKQAKTRAARVDKYVPKILAGKGFRE